MQAESRNRRPMSITILWQRLHIPTLLNMVKAVNHYTYLPTKIVKKNYEYNSSSVLKDITTTITYDDYGNPTSINTRDGNVNNANIQPI